MQQEVAGRGAETPKTLWSFDQGPDVPTPVTDGTLLVRQQSVTAGRDINMFHIWVYQPKA